MKNCIYKIKVKKNDKFYIGSAHNFKSRKNLHLRDLKKGNHHNILLQRHYNKYGASDLIFEILEFNIDSNNLLQREQFYIDSLKPKFNICKIAGSKAGLKTSKETKEKLRLSHLGQSRPHTEETKEKIRKSLLGRKYSKKRRANMSKATKGKKKKPFTEEHKKNMSKAFTGLKKKPQTQEHINKRTKYLIGNTWNNGKQNRNTPVVQFKNGILIKEFKSVKEAAESLGTTLTNICHNLNGRTKTAKGYTFKYKKDFTSEC
jgi:group I intron endonuclease